MQFYKSLMIVLGASLLAQVCSCFYFDSTSASQLSRVRIPAITNVISKLEDYSFELTSDSDLDLIEMVNAYNEYKSLPPEVVIKMREALPLFHLVSDFLLIPMEKYTRLLNENGDDFQDKLIIRTETNYKHFRPLYMGLRNNKKDTINARKTGALVSSLLKLKKSKRLNKAMIINSMIEFNSYTRQLDEISLQMDIFNNKDELEKILNYLNRDTTKILKERIFPIAHLVNNSNERLEFLSAIFLDQLTKLGYSIVENQLREPNPLEVRGQIDF